MGPKCESVGAVDIHSALKFPSSCTSRIVQQIAVILEEPLTVSSATYDQSKSQVGRLAKQTSQKGRGKAKTVQSTKLSSQAPHQKLSKTAKILFATEVFNGALKSLTNAVRHQNGSSASPGKASEDNVSSSHSMANTEKYTGLKNVALCADIALAFLHTSKSKEADSWQLSAGMSSMIGKLIVLGFYDLSIKSLETLLSRLGLLVERTSAAPRFKSSGLSVADLLNIQPKLADDHLLGTIISCQLHAIKLLAHCNPEEAEKAIDYLTSEKRSNPLRLIFDAHEKGAITAKDAERQFIGLSHLLLNLCVENDVPGNTSSSESNKINPFTVFKYQLLAQESRQNALTTQKNQIDMAKDVLKPFLKSVKDFQRDTTVFKTAEYDYMKSALDDREKFVQRDALHPDFTSNQQSRNILLELKTILSKIGATLREQTEMETSMRIEKEHSDDVPTQRCYKLCKNCLSILQSSKEHKIIDKYFSELSRSVDEATDMSTSIWDEIVLLMSTTRRLAHEAWRRKLKAYPDHPAPLNLPEIRVYVSIILKTPSFCVSYLQNSSGNVTENIKQLAGSHRSEIINRVARPTIDAVIRVATVAVKKGMDHPKELFSALSDCCTLLSSLDSALSLGSLRELDKRLEGVHGALSNCLALVAAAFRQLEIANDKSQYLWLLEKSVTILCHYPKEDQNLYYISGKAEKLSNALVATGRSEEAQNYLELAIQCLSRADVLAHGISVGGPLYIVHRESASQDDKVKLVQLVRSHFAMTTELTQLPCFSASILEEFECNSEYTWFINVCRLMEVAKMVKENHKLTSSLIEESVKYILSLKLKLNDKAQKLQCMSIVLQIVASTGFLLQEGVCSILHNELLDMRSLPDIASSDHNRALILSCQINLLLAGPELDWQNVCNTLACLNLALQSGNLILNPNTFFRSFQLQQLELLSEVFGLQGFTFERIRCLNILVASYQPNIIAENSSYKIALYYLANEQIRHGFLEHAWLTLCTVAECVKKDQGDILWAAKSMILRARYYSALGQCTGAAKYVVNADEFIKAAGNEISNASKRHKTFRFELMETYCDFLESQIELKDAQASSIEAMLFARACAKYAHKMWNYVSKSPEQSARGNYGKGGIRHISETADELRVLHGSAKEIKNGFNRRHWSVNSIIIRSLVKLSACLENIGQICEARYYLFQAKDIATCSKSIDWRRAVELDLARLNRLEGTLKNPIIGLKEIMEGCNLEFDLVSIRVKLEMCAAYLFKKDWDNLAGEVSEALKMIKGAHTAVRGDHTTSCSLSPSSHMTRISLQEEDNYIEGPFSLERLYEGLLSSSPDSETRTFLTNIRHGYKSLFHLLYDQLFLYLVDSDISRKNGELAREPVAKADNRDLGPIDISSYHIMVARLRIRQALTFLSTSPMFNALCEAPISFPCQALAPIDFTPSNAEVKLPQKDSRKTRPKKNPSSSLLATNFPNDLLKAALSELIKAIKTSHQGWSTFRMHEVSDDLVRVTMLLAAGGTTHFDKINAYSAIIALEVGRNFAWKRYTAACAVEQGLRNVALEPTTRLPEHKIYSENMDITSYAATFHELYIEILPESWTAISLSLSQDKSELRISRLRRNKTPFVVSIPLNRQPENSEEASFDFQTCKSELNDIISQANNSTRDTVYEEQKGAKSKWWSTRTQLDERLKNLLTSIDDVWLGGFRGIFSQKGVKEIAFSQFSSNFQKILQKHLPSRQGRAKARITDYVTLDVQVLELFLGLGLPNNEGDIDDSLLDLLSFTIDVLQFHGENNAYDEIDFDAMILDTTEALRQYHFTAASAEDKVDMSHTLLILDKNLHAFPWESLPSMRGLSISRLPSLEAMRNIICAHQELLKQDNESKLCVTANDGVYVLNPGGDLINTEKTFKNRLSKLPGSWTSFVGRSPKEAELESCLQTRSLYLYLGHGSGGQYIRSRTVKNLQRCAVSLLLGCSSGTVTEAGQFESHGIPLTYLLAGSPAVMGTLWDVTDKDIDRFSTQALESWGLLQSDCANTQRSTKRQSRTSSLQQTDLNIPTGSGLNQATAVSLDTAVSQARDACLMRYLNGAAPVVYGVPIFLK